MAVSTDLLKFGTCIIKPSISTYTYSNTTVFVIGCGGTGGRIIPLLAQHIANHNYEIATNPRNKQHIQHRMQLVLVDADTVEAKNLRRQNFFRFDVGKNKAQIFAERFGALYGMDIGYVDKYVSDEDNPFTTYPSDNLIVFDCTDNVKARRSIEKLANGNNTIIISCGNEDTFGQVVLGAKQGRTEGQHTKNLLTCLGALDGMISKPDMKNKKQFGTLPTLLNLYRDFTDTVAPSCTEIQLADDQSMPINSLVGQIAYNVFYSLVSGSSFKYNMVKCSINNIYTTNIVTNPLALRDLYIRGLYGDVSAEAYAAIAELLPEYNRTSEYRYSYTQVDFLSLARKHGKYAAPFANAWLTQAYRTDATTLAEIKALISGE